MGVTYLRHYPSLSSVVTIAIHESLIDHHGFQRSSRWTVKLRLYTPFSKPESLPPPPSQAKALYFLDFADDDAKVWSFTAQGGGATVAEGGNDAKEVKGVMIEGEKDLEVIVGKIQNMWSRRQEAVVEGHTFIHADVVIRVGHIRVGSAPRGVLFQIEHTKSKNPNQTIPQLRTLLHNLISPSLPQAVLEKDATTAETETDFRSAKLRNDEWTRCHEAYQIVKLLKGEGIL
ncbi:hypothetical protein HK097_007790 [Rhizophlyctis rosea]|uniref:Mediator of RNA polymerase II transcription subunit 20 n=1 Tax=Rhizophlyctis rosea TaxID=64517 RepID=A0AAD5X4I1_9FUNG|nr:hypothetical protein HK097_007790 [Rhizophlyctis rosea]